MGNRRVGPGLQYGVTLGARGMGQHDGEGEGRGEGGERARRRPPAP